MKSDLENQRKRKIQQLVKDVRKKFLTFKLGKHEDDKAISQLFQPITKQLHSIEDKQRAGLLKTTQLYTGPTQLHTAHLADPTQLHASPAQLRTAKLTGSNLLQKGPLTVPPHFSSSFLSPKVVSPIPPLQHTFHTFSSSTPTTKTSYPTSAFKPESLFQKPSYNKSPRFLPTNIEAETDEEEDVFPDDTKEEIQQIQDDVGDHSIVDEYLEQYPAEARKYVSSIWLLKDQSNSNDPTYGPKYDVKISKWFLGSKVINFDKKTSEIIIDNNERLPGTAGLYSLVFDKQPSDFTKDDLQYYKTILNLTNVHRRNFDATKQRRGTVGYKWLEIIKPLTSNQGGSLMTYNEKPIEYIYYDDVNEIIDRLRLLYASKEAGNTSVDNEIQSIIEELHESNIIY